MEQNNNNQNKPQGEGRPSGNRRNRHRGGRSHGKQNNRPRQEGAPVEAAQSERKASEAHAPKGQDGARAAKGQGGKAQRPQEQHAKGGQGGQRSRQHHGRRDHREGGETVAREVKDNTLQKDAAAPLSSTTFRAPQDKWLDDTFSPLHEVEQHDEDAEQNARRLLDAEGPLLFAEPQTDATAVTESTEEIERVEVVGVRFKSAGKMYYFAPGRLKLKRGAHAIVETARGEEYGEVCLPNERIPIGEVVQPLRRVVREATEQDARRNEENRQKEADAFRICQQKITEHKLEMKLVEAQYTFDNSKLLFYFTSDGRVDFRELVKDLAGVFRTRIELRQIGIRDEAKLLGGLGTCGRPLCCSGFLPDFVQVSIKMAKEQNLSLNSSKISGCCGRLMCCLRYEFDTYEAEIRLTPAVGTGVQTRDGRGQVVANHPLKGTVTVRLLDKDDTETHVYHRDEVRRLAPAELSELLARRDQNSQ